MLKVIRSKVDYEAALASIDRLIALDPEPGTRKADELEVLTVLVKDYESKQFPVQLPDPVEAIQFRMEQMGLSQRDLIPFIGSRARVSEVLSRKRPLTLNMLKALHAGLGIPAAILLRGEEQATAGDTEDELARFPVREMARRGWLRVSQRASEAELLSALKVYLAPLREASPAIRVLTRKTRHVRSDRPIGRHALMAWTARAIELARQVKLRGRYEQGCLTEEVLRGLVHLSSLDDGPRKAREYLSRYGVALVVVEHLPHTRLDGAVFFMASDRPVIALTLRYDRIDYFWFTLLHEIGHLVRDLSDDVGGFFDDLDSSGSNDPREGGADAFARDVLVPPADWERSPLRSSPNPAYVRELAARLGIHPAIVAGRVRREHSAYRILGNLVGHGAVRELFQEELREATA